MEGVEATRDRVLTYFGENSERYTKGGIVQAFFSASSGGSSLSNRYGFSWEKNEVPQRAVRSWPYLEPVEDHWDVDPDLGNPNASWERSVRASDIARLLRWEEVTDATLDVGESLASPAHVRFEGLDGGESRSVTVAGSWLRTHLGLKSSNIMSIDGELPEQSEAPVHPEPPPDPGVPEVPVRNDGDLDDPVWASSDHDPLPLFPDAIDSAHSVGIQAMLDNRLTRGCGDGNPILSRRSGEQGGDGHLPEPRHETPRDRGNQILGCPRRAISIEAPSMRSRSWGSPRGAGTGPVSVLRIR